MYSDRYARHHGHLRVGVFGASGYAGAELLRLAVRPSGVEGGAGDGGQTQAGGRVADLYPSLAAAYPDLTAGRRRPGRGRRARRGVPGPARTARPRTWSPSCANGSALVVDLAADFRLRDPALYPRWYGVRAPLPGPAGRGGVRDPRAVPRRPARRHAGRRRRLLPDGGRPGPGAAGPGRRDRGRRGSWSTRPAGCRARAGCPSRTPTSTPWTRTSPPTACSTTATRPRSSRPSAPRCIFTPHLAPMNRGILATCYARPAGRDRRRGARPARRAAPLLPGEPVRRRLRPIAVDQGHPGLQLRPPDGPLRPPHRLDRGHRRPRQPDQGRGRPGHPVRQPGPRPGRRRPACPWSGVYP